VSGPQEQLKEKPQIDAPLAGQPVLGAANGWSGRLSQRCTSGIGDAETRKQNISAFRAPHGVIQNRKFLFRIT
jgi:hypothetical protein